MEHERRLVPGQLLLEAGQAGCAWRVVQGALRLDAPGDPAALIGVALPGDLLGLGAREGQGSDVSARALVPCLAVAEPRPCRARAWEQQHRRTLDILRLRSGSAPARLRHLLVMLGEAVAQEAGILDLPSLRDMAAVIDSAPETVSRIISSLRRSDLVQQRIRQTLQFDVDELSMSALRPGMTSSRRLAPPLSAVLG